MTWWQWFTTSCRVPVNGLPVPNHPYSVSSNIMALMESVISTLILLLPMGMWK